MRGFECPDYHATFSVELKPEVGGPGTVVYIECEDLDSTVARLAERGVRIESGPKDEPWLWREARLEDPDGKELCLFQAGINRKNPPWRVQG